LYGNKNRNFYVIFVVETVIRNLGSEICTWTLSRGLFYILSAFLFQT